MSTDDEKLAALRAHWPKAELLPEGEKNFVFIPNMQIECGGQTHVVSALLRPWSNGDGYSTRLFFSSRFTTKGSNWNVFGILGRSWHACSWNGVPDNLPWFQIIASHITPLR